jgi:serine/threonine-protein kinase
MDADRWRQLQDWFAAARAIPSSEREAFLADKAQADPDLAAQVRALLIADAASGIMDAWAPQLASVAQVIEPAAPPHVGSYRIVSEIGRGGMGTVYLAERAGADFDHRVAIKLIGTSDAGDPLHQRFLAERRILAGLVHPSIARLLDGGVIGDGRPYLVMEFVDGLQITTYCAASHLDVPGRLRLFIDVCAAIQYAHQNLVIHRDLKPSNILVSGDGRVHLLDFGIAKLIDPGREVIETRSESRMMTPAYASPEQVKGEPLGTTSDIYSLGVLLYEMLCGYPPYEFANTSPLQVATIVCEQDPPAPSTRVAGTDRRLAHQLGGDLDSIVLMAMRKEPAQRYASADMLRQDVERYLAGQPVLAHRGSRRYRLKKFLRRHRVEAAAAAIVMAALVGGLTIAVTQGQRAARERDRAERALAESKGVTGFLLELFRSGEPGDRPAAELTALDLLQRGAVRADDLSNQPMVQARLLDVIGQMAYHLGRLDEAQSRLEQAITIQRTAGGDATGDLATSLIHLAWVHRTRNQHERARALVGEALDLRRGSLTAGHPDIADAYYELGWVAFGREQERLYRQALEILTGVPEAADRRIVILQALSTNLRRQGRLAEAVAAGRQALAIARAAFGRQHHTTGDAMIHLADHVADIENDDAAAEKLYRDGLDLVGRHFGDRSLRLLHGLNSLGRLVGRRGDAEAEALYRRALAISLSATGPGHPRIADQKAKLAWALMRQNRLPEAETLARESLEMTIEVFGRGHQIVAAARLPLIAEILDLQRRYKEADQVYESAFEGVRTSGAVNGELRRDYGLMLLRRGNTAGAEAQLLQSLSSLEQNYNGATHPNVQETKRALMTLYTQTGRTELVEKYRVPPGRFIPY